MNKRVMPTIDELKEFLECRNEYDCYEMLFDKFISSCESVITYLITFEPKYDGLEIYKFSQSVTTDYLKIDGYFKIRYVIADAIKRFNYQRLKQAEKKLLKRK